MDNAGSQSTVGSSYHTGKKTTHEPMNRPHSSFIVDGLGFKSIIDLLPCYLSIQDRSMHILFANQTFKYDFGEGIGNLCHKVYKGSPEKCETCPVQKTFDDKKVHISEERVRLSNGQMADMIVYSSPIEDSSGNVIAVIEMSTNITKVKEMQKELKNLGQSIAILSHDIKNILEGLQGGAYVVDEGLNDGNMELATRGWEIVKRNIDEITTVAQNILYSSKKRDLNYQKTSLNEVIVDVINLFQQKAKAMNIKLEYKTNTALPRIRLDPLSIRRMLENFIWNALEACKKDEGKQDHAVIVSADFHDRFHLKFEVEDNGVGMDEKTRASIFNEFYSTKGSEGTGLGLLVADRIIKEHGGRVEVFSNPGKGTIFRVIFRIN